MPRAVGIVIGPKTPGEIEAIRNSLGSFQGQIVKVAKDEDGTTVTINDKGRPNAAEICQASIVGSSGGTVTVEAVGGEVLRVCP